VEPGHESVFIEEGEWLVVAVQEIGFAGFEDGFF
jgi:hypothetical protein